MRTYSGGNVSQDHGAFGFAFLLVARANSSKLVCPSLLRRFDRIDEKLQIRKREGHPPDGDRLLDNQDMCQLPGVTKRTMARYRQKKLVRYYIIRGRVWYKASEVAEFLKKKGMI